MFENSINLEKFSSIPVYSEKGEPHDVKQLWQKHTAVIVFIRHFG